MPDHATTTRSFWTGTISFGLVSIPVDLYPANRTAALGMRMLGPDGQPLKRQYICSSEGKTVGQDDLVRGYEVSEDEFVTVSDEELESLAPDKSRDIDLNRFVPRDSVSPAYFERGHYLAPAGSSSKAYRLLADTMERAGKVGIGTFVMRSKAYVMAIFAERGILHGQTLRFFDELRSAKDVGVPSHKTMDAKLVAEMKKAIESGATEKFPADSLHDERAVAIRSVAEMKLKKHEDVVEIRGSESEEVGEDEDEGSSEDVMGPKGKVIDLMEVLRQRLGASLDAGHKKPSGATPQTKRKPAVKAAPAKAAKSPRKTSPKPVTAGKPGKSGKSGKAKTTAKAAKRAVKKRA